MTKNRRHRRTWTQRELEVMRREYPRRTAADVARLVGHSVASVYNYARLLGLRKSPEFLASPASGRLRPGDTRGLSGRFRRGHQPWNKGTHWTAGGRSAETRFKKGSLNGRAAKLYKPLGAYRINADGYLEQKITHEGRGGQRWKAVHRLVWEAVHGPVPPGHVVVFKPGRRTTKLEAITLDAVELVSREELMRRNSYHNRYPKEIGLVIQLRGALMRQINKRVRQQHEEPDGRPA